MKTVIAALSSSTAQIIFVVMFIACGLAINIYSPTSVAQAAVAKPSAEKPYLAVIMKISAEQDSTSTKTLLPMYLRVNQQAVKINHIIIQESNQVSEVNYKDDTITVTLPKMEKEKQVNMLKEIMTNLMLARVNVIEI